jgi:hypothetical protein
MSEVVSEFETAMQHGLAAHRQRDYEEALAFRLTAFAADPDQPGDIGRAARDIAFSLDRLGNTVLANEVLDGSYLGNGVVAGAYAEYAVREHRELMESGSTHGAREFMASAACAGTILVRQRQYIDAYGMTLEAEAVSQQLQTAHDLPHQYDVNRSGRVAGIFAMMQPLLKRAEPLNPNTSYSDADNRIASIHETLRQSPTREAWLYARHASALASVSETAHVLGANPDLSQGDIGAAQRKARLRGRAAKAVVILQALPTHAFTEPIARTLLERVVL